MPSRYRLYFALFVLSGFCGLTYQVVWLRIAFSHFGVITPVLSVVVSVFMLGLALGSWVAGRWIEPLQRRTQWSGARFYAITEALIGVGAFVVPTLLTMGDVWLLPQGGMESFSYLALSALAITAALLPWCFLMGATFPLMLAYLRQREEENPSGFSYLYLANVIGAMAGTLLTANILIELFGFRGTLTIAGCLNFTIAAMSWIFLDQKTTLQPIDTPAPRRDRAMGTESMAGWSVMGLLFVTGFVSMSLEVIWTRAFTPVLTTTIYAFALVLAVYLVGTAAGSAWYRRDLRLQHKTSRALLLGGLTFAALWTVLITDPRLHLNTFGVEIGIFPLCLILGYFTPQLMDEITLGDPQRVGRAYAVNVTGCIIGPLIASYFLLPWFGVKNAMLLLTIPLAIFWFMESRAWRSRWKIPAWTVTLAAGLAALCISISHEEKYVDGIVRRDATATVISATAGRNKYLYVNGQGITVLDTTTKCIAHLPMTFLNRAPRKVLTICFGMGTTFRSLMSWGVDTTAVELVPSVRAAFGYYHADAAALMADPHGRIIIDDGRRFLRRTGETFDVITIDPPPPVEAAGSSLLYSKEMYGVIQKRLAPDGILQQWYPGGANSVEAKAIARSLAESFPFVRVFYSFKGEGLHFLASRAPLDLPEATALAARLPMKARRDLVEWEHSATPEFIISTILKQELSMNALQGSDLGRRITDDRPYNEYYWLRRTLAKASLLHIHG